MWRRWVAKIVIALALEPGCPSSPGTVSTSMHALCTWTCEGRRARGEWIVAGLPSPVTPAPPPLHRPCHLLLGRWMTPSVCHLVSCPLCLQRKSRTRDTAADAFRLHPSTAPFPAVLARDHRAHVHACAGQAASAPVAGRSALPCPARLCPCVGARTPRFPSRTLSLAQSTFPHSPSACLLLPPRLPQDVWFYASLHTWPTGELPPSSPVQAHVGRSKRPPAARAV